MKPRSFVDRRPTNADLGLPSEFALSEVTSNLARPRRLKELPAVKHLGVQLQELADTIEADPDPSPRPERAVQIASDFFRASTADRVSNRFTVEPAKGDHRLDQMHQLLDESAKRANRAYRYVRDQVLNGRKGDIEQSADGWIRFLQGDPQETAYRICLSPRLPYAAGIFAEIAKTVPAHLSYAMNMRSTGSSYGAAVDRVDEVFVFAGRETLPKLLPIVERVYKTHQVHFVGQLASSEGTYVPVEGVSIGSTNRELGESKTADVYHVSMSIDGALRGALTDQLKRIVRAGFKNWGQFNRSPAGVLMWQALSSEHGRSTHLRIGRWTLDDTQRRRMNESANDDDEQLSECYFRALYEEWIRSLFKDCPLNREGVRQNFIRQLPERMVLHHPWVRKFQRQGAIESSVAWPHGSPDIAQATKIASLAASVYRRERTGEPVGEAIEALLKEEMYQPRKP